MTDLNPQFLRTQTGEELVVLTRAEFDALREAAEDGGEADDIARFDERMAELHAAADQRLPVEVSASMLNGDRLLRALRRWKTMTQTQLARQSGLAQGYISDIDSGKKAGTPEALRSLAAALGVNVEWLLPSGPQSAPSVAEGEDRKGWEPATKDGSQR